MKKQSFLRVFFECEETCVSTLWISIVLYMLSRTYRIYSCDNTQNHIRICCEQGQMPINHCLHEILDHITLCTALQSHKQTLHTNIICKHMLEKKRGIFATCLTQSRSCFQIIQSPIHDMNAVASPHGEKTPNGVLVLIHHAIHPTT